MFVGVVGDAIFFRVVVFFALLRNEQQVYVTGSVMLCHFHVNEEIS